MKKKKAALGKDIGYRVKRGYWGKSLPEKWHWGIKRYWKWVTEEGTGEGKGFWVILWEK